ncbi:MAG: hypothetical protein E7672_00040 [Ruminococcaceae bacterium]|nr:hypothetical protein [Oscillospiraceae bacterium]
MKKVLSIIMLVLLCLSTVSCISLKTHMLEDYFPPMLDETTHMPYTDSVTVKNTATNEVIKFTTPSEISNIYLQLSGIECSRHNITDDLDPVFVVTFYSKYESVSVEICSATAFNIGKYRFSSIGHTLDLSYIASLFE